MRTRIKTLFNKNRKMGKGGIFCICSAHPDVVTASLRYAKRTGCLLSIETTAHQINHDGGYMGMTPSAYVAWVKKEAAAIGLSENDYILGGDHLGPTSWKHLSSLEAMEHSKKVVDAYVKSGYYKIHLDTSIFCSDDSPEKTSEDTLVSRTVELAKISESAAISQYGSAEHLFYIVGTEVPLPGGAQKNEARLSCTTPAAARKTLQMMKKHFLEAGLESAWDRVYGLVLQPGVEYGDDSIFIYQKDMAKDLKPILGEFPNLVYEAHSTDYQTSNALKALVEDHFAILKVGPWLTSAWREAVFSLDLIEKELPNFYKKSDLRGALEQAMKANNKYWKIYYTGTQDEVDYKLKFSLSDRCRYYWEFQEVKDAVTSLLRNLSSLEGGIPYEMLSQYIPWAVEYQENKNIVLSPQEILFIAVERVLEKYTYACQ